MENPDSMIIEAFALLYPSKEFKYKCELIYTDRFKDYGANAQLHLNNLTIKFSRKWHGVSKEIQIGLIQELIQKLIEKGYGELIEALLANEGKVYTKKGRLNKSGACRVLDFKTKQLEDKLMEMKELLKNDVEE